MLGEVPVTLIAVELDGSRIEVLGIGLGFSDAEDVWLVGVDVRVKHLLV